MPGRLWVQYPETFTYVQEEKGMAMGTRRKGVGTLVIMAVLPLSSAVPGQTDRGGGGYRGHGHGGHGHSNHGHSGPGVFIRPRLVVPFGPSCEPYGDPPVVIAPSPRVSVDPPARECPAPSPIVLVLL